MKFKVAIRTLSILFFGMILAIGVLVAYATPFSESASESAAAMTTLLRPAVAVETTVSPLNLSSSSEADIFVEWVRLHDNWIKDLQWVKGWLYYASVAEYKGDLGVDPETGWPLPNRVRWERWLSKDNEGRIEVVLTRRTDQERGNVWLYSWIDGVSLHHNTGTTQPDNNWYQFTLKNGLNCFSATGKQAIQTIVSAERSDAGGVSQYTVIFSTEHEPVRGVDGDPRTFVATELRCTRDAATGEPLSIEQINITDNGERVTVSYLHSFVHQVGVEPPKEMLSLLEQR